MNESLQSQLYHLFGTAEATVYVAPNGASMLTHTHEKSVYAKPDGSVTTDRDEAREAWYFYNLQRNVTKCHMAGKNKYCAGRL